MTIPIPDFALGTGQRFKLSASEIAGRRSNFTCPVGLALQSRLKAKSLRPNDSSGWYRNWDDASKLHFALRDSYHALEAGRPITEIVRDETKLTHVQRRFLKHALELLEDLKELVSEDAGQPLQLSGDDVQRSAKCSGLDGDVTVFGRYFRGDDGGVQEIVRMRLKELRSETRPEDEDWVTVAAMTLAYMPNVPADARIRISEFSLATGEYRCAFDGYRADILTLPRVAQIVPEALTGSAFRPGQGCANCGFLNACPAVPKCRGVLGLPGKAVATRHLTSADLHAYDRCPTAFQAQRRDHLPDGYHELNDLGGSTTARDRGMAVHAWLKWAHSREPGQGCEAHDLPDPLSDDASVAAAAAGLSPDAYEVAYPYLVRHLDHCMRGLEGLGGWAHERRVVVFDPDADIVVISTPDSICSVADTGEPIWREVKSTGVLPPDVQAALRVYPGFALNVALIAAEVPIGGDGFAELEVLTPTGSRVFHVALHDGALVAEAQRVVADIGHRFGSDLTFDRRPSGACHYCSAHRWCDPPAGPQAMGQVPIVDDSEFQDLPDPF